MNTPGPLAGRTIVVTRPRAQAAPLAEAISAAGGVPLVFPLLEILPPDDPQALADGVARLLQMSSLRAGEGDSHYLRSRGQAEAKVKAASEERIARTIEAVLEEGVGRAFPTLVRATRDLQTLLARDPWGVLDYPSGAKRVVTFLRTAPTATPTSAMRTGELMPSTSTGAPSMCSRKR